MKDDILLAYYSWSGNTRKIAGLIERETGGTLFEIEPVQPYTTDYRAAVAQAKEEIQAGFRPDLKAFPSFQDAVALHELIDAIEQSAQA
jgi:flavodoxin